MSYGRIGRIITAGAVFMVAAGLASNVATFTVENPSPLQVQLFKAFNLDNELNVPTWYASFLLATNGLLLFLLAADLRARRSPDARTWTMLGLVFFALSVDEATSIHEHVGLMVSAAIGEGDRPQAWILAALPIVLLIGLLCLRALVRLPGRAALGMVAAGMLYVGGAAGVEAIGWYFQTLSPGWSKSYLMLTWVEETLEFSGQVLFTWVLLSLLAARGTQFGLTRSGQST